MSQFKRKVLFVCVHNSARSQMAETFLNKIAGDRFEASSAGLEPGTINPLVVAVMKEEGYDLSSNTTTSVFELFKTGESFSFVIAVCDEAAEQCPIFPGKARRINWSFPDPSQFEGTHEEKLAKTRAVRDEIERAIIAFADDTLEQEESYTANSTAG